MNSGTDKGLGRGVVIALPLLLIGCCVGLPLLAAASISVAALAWGGALVGGLVAVAAFSVVLLRRRARARACRTRDALREPSATQLPTVSTEVGKR